MSTYLSHLNLKSGGQESSTWKCSGYRESVIAHLNHLYTVTLSPHHSLFGELMGTCSQIALG
ncbi:MAG: hypothetical protein RIE73_21585 [Coleofasciculus sp. C1-SOL-03]